MAQRSYSPVSMGFMGVFHGAGSKNGVDPEKKTRCTSRTARAITATAVKVSSEPRRGRKRLLDSRAVGRGDRTERRAVERRRHFDHPAVGGRSWNQQRKTVTHSSLSSTALRTVSTYGVRHRT